MPTLENVRVLGALETQRELVRRYDNPTTRAYTATFVQDVVYKNALYRDHRDFWIRHFAEMEQDRLRHADPWWVNAEMSTLTAFAAGHDTLGPEPLHPEDVPTERGFALFESPLHITDVNGETISIAAFCWSHQELGGGMSRAGIKRGAMGLFVSWYSDALDESDTSVEAYLRLENQDRNPVIRTREELVERFGRYHLVHFTPWPYGVGYDLSHPAAQNPLRLVHTFFALSQQRVAVQSPLVPDRAARRRWDREMRAPSTLRVVTLRRGIEHETDPEEREVRDVEWSHRWLVTGHWRRIWDAKRQRFRHVWVRGYVKGPKDKPLVLKDQAYKLVR